jgi:hypothetical protein
MISLNFNISNPWSHRFENLWCKSYVTPFKHKFLEMELLKDTSILSFMFQLAGRTSHGGLSMELGLLGYSFSFNFYDNRHWNYDAGRYFKYNEELGEH